MWGMPYSLILFMQFDTSFEYYLEDDKKKEMAELLEMIKEQEKYI
jgi:hypothetical protein